MQLRHAATLAFQGCTTLRTACLPARFSLQMRQLKAALGTDTDIRTVSWKRVTKRAERPSLNTEFFTIYNCLSHFFMGSLKDTAKRWTGYIHPYCCIIFQ